MNAVTENVLSARFLAAVSLAVFAGRVTAEEPVDFERDVQPIFEEHCSFCHGEDEQESRFRLDRRVVMLKGGDIGLPAVVPGKPEESYLLEVVQHLDAGMEMPPDSDRIPEEQIATLKQWIAEGAVVPGQMDDTLEEEKSDHWAYQPVVRPDVPRSEAATASGSSPVDAFLLAKLQEKGLGYSPVAEPRALLRRASVVLTGLAPTPEETEAFLAEWDADADAAYTRLVDRLMASPHFGERWAQHWLDVIRWAETNGSESNMYRKNAWIYRDYVIRSFNEDKPYDQFLFEQLAGDTVGVGEATGYLVSGPHVPIATVGQQPEARRQARADRLDEIVQTVGASALGTTIGCARCHNHKFDPISITDYYSMTAVFEGVEFGARRPELSDDHPRKVRATKLWQTIREQRKVLREFGPWREDWQTHQDVFFPPQKTDAVRLNFQNNYVIVDELELFGPEEPNRNLAASSTGTVASADPETEKPNSEPFKLNDGTYGTEKWLVRVPKTSEKRPWVILEFPEPRTISRMKISKNREDRMTTDYLTGLANSDLGIFNLQVRREDGSWETIAGVWGMDKKVKENKKLSAAHAVVQEAVNSLLDEGPRPSFVGSFIKPAKSFVFSRGSPENPRGEVQPAGLSELDGQLDLPEDPSGSARRVAFAKWLIEPANPLTSRVMANRIWHHVFGAGLVTTTSDFGLAGAPPTHPVLLDWLASELASPTAGEAAPWSTKHIIRLLVTSDAFKQSSAPRPDGLAVDAGSALLWRFPPRRVEAEVIRDSVLRASGSLAPQIGGKSFRIHNVKKRYAQWEVTDNHGPETWRRMIYQERMRRVDDRMFTAFDFPDCGQIRAKRPVSTTPLQALNLLNSDFAVEQAGLIAEQAVREAGDDVDAQIGRCFERILGRPVGPEELREVRGFVESEGLALLCRTLINTNEFVFLP